MTNTAQLHAEIAEQTKDFLANGGTITVLPYMPDRVRENELNLFAKHANRLETARKKGSEKISWRKQNVARFNNEDISSAAQRKRATAKARKFKKAVEA